MRDSTSEREQKIDLIVLVVLVGFALSAFYHYMQGVYLGRPYPHNTFLFLPSDRWADFFIVVRFNVGLNPYLGDAVSPQLPFTNLLFYLFGLLGERTAFIAYMLLVISIFPLFVMASLRTSTRWRWYTNSFVLSFLTYPFLISFDRANVDTLLFTLLLVSMHLFARKRYLAASLLLAPAIAMKLYPAVLLLLLVRERKHKEVAAAVIAAAALTVVSLMCFRGGFWPNLRFLLRGANFDAPTAAMFLDNTNCVQRGVSLFTAIKIALIETGRIASVNMARVLSVYIRLGAIAFIPLAAYVVFVEQVLWKRLTLLVFSMMLLPYFSGDYRLMHVYLPLLAFIGSDERSGLGRYYALAFALLLIPKDYVLFQRVLSDAGTHDISMGVVLNQAILVLMSVTIVGSGLWRRLAMRRRDNSLAC